MSERQMEPSFVVSQEARYHNGLDRPEVVVMSHDGSDGVDWEFVIRWVSLGSDLHPKVEMFDDAWPAWLAIPEFFGRLAHLTDRSTAGVVKMLAECGFKDVTQRER